MRVSANGVLLIKQFEGLELEAYQDIAGIWTIGYGHTESAQPGMRISEREAEELLKKDLRPREDAVTRLVSVSLNQNEFDALVSFVYNVGVGAFQGSTARKRLNRGDRVGAAEALTWWNKATVGGVLRVVTGLTRRRSAEAALFLAPVAAPQVRDPRSIAENSRITPIEDSPRRENIAGSRSVQGATVAGGAGVAATSLGQNAAGELDRLETDVQSGVGLTIDPPALKPPAPDDTPADGEGADATVASVGPPVLHPAKHEHHTAEAQMQFALMVLIVVSVLYIIWARIDDWLHYKR
jgi:lysozyme